MSKCWQPLPASVRCVHCEQRCLKMDCLQPWQPVLALRHGLITCVSTGSVM